MKLLCFNRYIFIFIILTTSLFGALQDKSAVVYYGNKISYPMVGIHDYIIVQPSLTNTYTHGFDIYKDKMYAYVSIGEIDKNIKEYKLLKKEWILTQNKAWSSDVLDLTNPEYREFLFTHMIEPQMRRGFKNFFFDTLDSYQLAVETDKQREKSKSALAKFINEFHTRYPDSKLIINRGFEIIDRIHNAVTAVLFESYYRGLNGPNLDYKKVSDSDRAWLDIYLKKIKSYGLDVIAVDYLEANKIKNSDLVIQKLQKKGFIPFISTKELTTYGRSSKNAIKREIFTLIDERVVDRIEQSAHTLGAMPLEYLGYIEKLQNIKKPLPSMQEIQHYAGVIIWLREDPEDPQRLAKWILAVKESGVKILFASNFPVNDPIFFKKLDIELKDFQVEKNQKSKIFYKDKIIGYEIEPFLSEEINYYHIKTGKALLTIADNINQKSTLAAIMPWGGYAVEGAFAVEIMNDNIWVVNPFELFTRALRLKPLVVPDVTTKNGKRILFTHIDGDGIMNRVEWNTKLFSGDTILNDILKKYPIPHSVSVIGAEIDSNGLYPAIAEQLQDIVKEMYALKNVEPATHTFTHPFFWSKIVDGHLPEKYHLKVKNYNFSVDREIGVSLKNINRRYVTKNGIKANTVFWSGDCQPHEKALEYTYKRKILNINGGDTYITNTHPWLAYIAPLGLQRGDYYQIYTGAQNENIFTHEWLGPFWGFKKVIQTFKLTNSPRRFKPIDVYYHLYSGSKRASLNALQYVFDWAIKQDVNPIFTSEYIPKVMDYYTVSMSEDNGTLLVEGMKNIKTLRVEKENAGIDFKVSKNILGVRDFEKHTYFHVGKDSEVLFKEVEDNRFKNNPYLISANGKVDTKIFNSSSLKMNFSSYLPLRLTFNLPKGCKLTSSKKVHRDKNGTTLSLKYKSTKKVNIDVQCK